MLSLQAVPVPGKDIFKLLRARVRHANTWEWANKARTRLRHVQRRKGGHIRIANAAGVLVASVHPKSADDSFYLAEKFTGRLVAWFANDLSAINVQFTPEAVAKRGRRTR